MKVCVSSFRLFFVVVAVFFSLGYSSSGIVKICIVNDPGRNDTELRTAVDSIALFIAKNHTKAPQIFEQTTEDVCEFIGGIDRAKMIADFILVVKRNGTKEVNCDVEWGRESFAIMKIHSNTTANQSSCAVADNKFYATIAFTSQETPTKQQDGTEIKWRKVLKGKQLLNLLWPRFLSAASRIPDDYAFKAEREERLKRRTLKAVIAIMSLVVCSLLVIMFLGSLSRYNEAQAQKTAENARKQKKLEQQQSEPAKKGSSEKSEKPKETETTKKSEKSKKSIKLIEPAKSEKSETKNLMSDSSKKEQ